MNNQKIKHIVFFRRPPDSMAWGGLEKLCLDWFKRIDYRSCRVTLAVTESWHEVYTGRIAAAGLPVAIADMPCAFDRFFFLRFWKSLRFLRALKPSAVVFLQGRFGCFDFAYVLAARCMSQGQVYMYESLGAPPPWPKTSKRYFGFLPGLGLWWYAEKFGALARAYFSKKIVVMSHEVRGRLISIWRYPASKIVVRYHGVDVAVFSPSDEVRLRMRASLQISPMDKVIIVTARLSKEKCIHRAIKALSSLSREFSNLRLLIVGGGPLEQELKLQARNLSCAEQIIFSGHVDNVADYLKMSDIFILPSDNEGFGISLVEALATGLICVATRCPGPNEIIKDGRNGFLVDKDSESVRQGLRRALSLSPAERQRITLTAREDVRKNFEVQQNVAAALETMEIPFRGVD